MKDLLTNNWKLKLFAVLLAILAWFTVVNITNPEIPDSIAGIPVEVRNADILSKQETPRTYKIGGSGSAVVEYRVRQLSADKVRKRDFTVYVDFNEWHPSVGTLPVHVEYTGDSNIIRRDSIRLKTEILKVDTEALLTKTFRVRVDVRGTPAEGYTIGETSSSPNSVSVTAPESVMDIIDHISIAAEVGGANSDVSQDGELIVYDGNGTALELKKNEITMTSERAGAVVDILKVNTIPVAVTNVTGTPAEGYRYTQTSCSVASVQVAGSKSAVSALPSIILDSDAIDVTGATGDVTVEIDLRDFLPSGVSIIGAESTMATVTMQVEKLEEREFTITKDDVEYMNPADNKTYDISADWEAVFTVTGLKEDLAMLNLSMMRIQVDVGELNKGSEDLPLIITFGEEYNGVFEVKEPLVVNVTVIKAG